MKIAKTLVVAAMTLIICCLFGCGGDTKTVYVEKQAPATIYLDPVNKTQKIVINFDDNGNVDNGALYGSGSLEVKANQIMSADYSSYRQYMEANPVVDWKTHTITVDFKDVINNDEYVSITLYFNSGDSYLVAIGNLPMKSTRPMVFRQWDASFDYGNQESTYIEIISNGNGVDIYGEFGCDKLVGLQEDVDIADVDHIEWAQLDGIAYPAAIEQKTEKKYAGSFTFFIPNIQCQVDPVYGTNPNTVGELRVVLKDGRRIRFDMGPWGVYTWGPEYAQPFPDDESIMLITIL